MAKHERSPPSRSLVTFPLRPASGFPNRRADSLASGHRGSLIALHRSSIWPTSPAAGPAGLAACPRKFSLAASTDSFSSSVSSVLHGHPSSDLPEYSPQIPGYGGPLHWPMQQMGSRRPTSRQLCTQKQQPQHALHSDVTQVATQEIGSTGYAGRSGKIRCKGRVS